MTQRIIQLAADAGCPWRVRVRGYEGVLDWLEHRGFKLSFYKSERLEGWVFKTKVSKWSFSLNGMKSDGELYDSLKEAQLAGIEFALEYIIY